VRVVVVLVVKKGGRSLIELALIEAGTRTGELGERRRAFDVALYLGYVGRMCRLRRWSSSTFRSSVISRSARHTGSRSRLRLCSVRNNL
jgi:hypothetical protein